MDFFTQQKQSPLNHQETNMIEERIKYGKIYLNNYYEEKNISSKQQFVISDQQRQFIKLLANNLSLSSDNEINTTIFNTIKQSGIKSKDAFTAFYQTLIQKPFGPKAVDLINQIGLNQVIKLLKTDREVVDKTTTYLFPTLNNPEVFYIDKEIAQKYPSINIGIAIIKNITIKESDLQLKNQINEFVLSQQHLTNDVISSYPEVKVYRQLYKQMGIDWHSKRPSPEALLRRIALKKDLYSINTCVDSYNLIVMKNRVSIGAFDYDKLKFPTVLRFPKPDEEILLLGDDKPTKYQPTDLAYFDQHGGYNIYFNYRDAKRTAVTNFTKNIILNIDGINDIDRSMVEQSLKESIEIITKYCGGTVELAGIVTATR